MSQQVVQRVQELILEYRDAVRWERANELLHPSPDTASMSEAKDRSLKAHRSLSAFIVRYIDKVDEFTGTLEDVVGQAKHAFASFAPPQLDGDEYPKELPPGTGEE